MDAQEAIRIAWAYLEPRRRRSFRVLGVQEYPECWSVSVGLPETDAVTVLPDRLRLEVDKATRQVTECPSR